MATGGGKAQLNWRAAEEKGSSRPLSDSDSEIKCIAYHTPSVVRLCGRERTVPAGIPRWDGWPPFDQKYLSAGGEDRAVPQGDQRCWKRFEESSFYELTKLLNERLLIEAV